MRLPRLGREGFSEEVTFELKNGCKGASPGESWGQGISYRGQSLCKGPEAGLWEQLRQG